MGGPFVKELGDRQGAYYSKRTWYTQAKPYVKPLPFRYEVGTAVNPSVLPASHFIAPPYGGTGDENIASHLSNKLVARYRDKVAETAQLAVALLERRQAVSMISGRAMQLLKGARQIRKGNFKGAAKTFGVKTPKGVSRKKQFANNWLEFHFGWVPMLGDMYDAATIFQKPVPDGLIRVKGKATFVKRHTVLVSGGSSEHKEYEVKLAMRGRVVVDNPDLWLLNSAGLLNPASIVWEMVPFSFVVDWFTNFGACLDGMTSRLGLKFESESHTYCCNYYKELLMKSLRGDVVAASGKGYSQERYLGVPGLTPEIPPFRGFSVTRGVTAISLLLQFLKH